MISEQPAPVVRAVGLRKSYEFGNEKIDVLCGIDFDLGAGESMAITGPSGSGKSTLLHLIGILDHPSAGRVEIAGKLAHALPEPEQARFRNRTIGFVFQDALLLPQYSVLENVLLPTFAFPIESARAVEERARQLLDRVGLSHRVAHRPAQLSGGERQRAAVARALVLQPPLVLCDEPTGSLDRRSADAVGDLLLGLHREARSVLIVVTHAPWLAERMGRRCELQDGRCSVA